MHCNRLHSARNQVRRGGLHRTDLRERRSHTLSAMKSLGLCGQNSAQISGRLSLTTTGCLAAIGGTEQLKRRQPRL